MTVTTRGRFIGTIFMGVWLVVILSAWRPLSIVASTPVLIVLALGPLLSLAAQAMDQYIHISGINRESAFPLTFAQMGVSALCAIVLLLTADEWQSARALVILCSGFSLTMGCVSSLLQLYRNRGLIVEEVHEQA